MAAPDLFWKNGRFGQTSRPDTWWLSPLLVFLGLGTFLVYANWAAWQNRHYTYGPYISPFYSPEIYGDSPHAMLGPKPSWYPGFLPFSPALLILWIPGLFRLTCYYYRGAYYRSFWADPPACAVGEPRKSYWGENHWPLLFQNAHRYALYFALLFIVILSWDVLLAFRWPTNRNGELLPDGSHQFGVGLGTLLMLVNVLLIAGFTFGCNSLRHLAGGRLDCFSCPNNIARERSGYKAWRFVSWFNERHALWAWLSLFSVGFTDLYIRLCSM